MSTLLEIETQIKSNPIILYMKGTPDFPQCGFSARAVQALKTVGAEFFHVNVLEAPEIRQTLPQYANWPTFPQLYINGELIGGSDIILELYHNGELAKLVQTSSEQQS